MHTEDAIAVTYAILMDTDATNKDRLTAAALLFSRGWGLPSQSITVEGMVQHAHMVAGIDPTRLTADQRSAILAAIRRPSPDDRRRHFRDRSRCGVGGKAG